MKAGPKPDALAARLPLLVGRTPAARVEYFFKTYLTHVKGEWAGQPLVLAPWHREQIIKPLFNTLNPAKQRRYRTCYVEVPRKSAKSTIAAGIALYMLFCDGEPGAEVISAAADRQQAHVTFDIARSMVEASPELAKRTKIYRRELYVPGTDSSYKVISSEAYSKHGLNLSAAVVDELHAHENAELLEVLRTSFGSRRQPLLFMITTAGYDRTSVCWMEHEMAVKVRDHVIDDPAYLPVIYGAELTEEWTDPAVWKRVNPGYGITIKAEYLAQECRRAQEMPSYENAFKRLHLNMWTAQSERWLDQAAWDACGGAAALEALHGRVCFGGLDLALTTDLAALALVFPLEEEETGRRYVVLPRFWIPRDRIDNPEFKREPRIREALAMWVNQGLITATEGNTIDNDAIRRDINALGAVVDIREIGYDKRGAADLAPRLEGDGIPMVPMAQGYFLSAPMRELERLIRARLLAHGGHPVLRWMFGNVAVTHNAEDYIKPDKQKSGEKIDGIVALIMAVDRMSRTPVTTSIYDARLARGEPLLTVL